MLISHFVIHCRETKNLEYSELLEFESKASLEVM